MGSRALRIIIGLIICVTVIGCKAETGTREDDKIKNGNELLLEVDGKGEVWQKQ